MRDKRPVDELSIEELERVLAIRKREARQTQLDRMKREGRMVATPEMVAPAPASIESMSNGANELPLIIPTEQPGVAAGVAAPAPARKSTPPQVQRTGVPRFEDDVDDVLPMRTRGNDAAWRNFVNVSLLLVEIAAVLGLFFIGYQMFTETAELEQETRAAQRMANATSVAAIPTLAATPSIRLNDVVLPGGHVIVNGVARPNFDEIPERYRAQLQYEYSQPVLSRPEPTDRTALFVSIPALNIDEPITQGSDWEALKLGVTQVLNGYDPIDPLGNVVLAAHNDIYGELFRNLDQLQPGDQFTIRTATEIFVYEISHTDIVEPTDVQVLDSQGRQTATLISCYPHGRNDKRIIVVANLVNA